MTVTLDGGGGAALMTGMVLDDREIGGGDGALLGGAIYAKREIGGDGGLVGNTIFADREMGGDGGLVTGGLRTRFMGLAAGCGAAVVVS